jgi:hypothetical protein
MVLRHREKRGGWSLHEAEEIHFTRQVVGGGGAQLRDLVAHALFIERRGVCSRGELRLAFSAAVRIELELSVDNRLDEPAVRGGDMTGKLDRRARLRIRLVVAVPLPTAVSTFAVVGNLALESLARNALQETSPDRTFIEPPIWSASGT